MAGGGHWPPWVGYPMRGFSGTRFTGAPAHTESRTGVGLPLGELLGARSFTAQLRGSSQKATREALEGVGRAVDALEPLDHSLPGPVCLGNTLSHTHRTQTQSLPSWG